MASYGGIDPGLSGAIALHNGSRVRVWDIPTHTVKRGKTYKRRLDDAGMLRLARFLADAGLVCVAIEDVGGLPRQSAPGAFTFGDLTGAIRMSFLACGVPVHKVPSVVWRAGVKLKGDKDDARALASRLFPADAHQWPNKGHDGRAEAALIARYAAHAQL